MYTPVKHACQVYSNVIRNKLHWGRTTVMLPEVFIIDFYSTPAYSIQPTCSISADIVKSLANKWAGWHYRPILADVYWYWHIVSPVKCPTHYIYWQAKTNFKGSLFQRFMLCIHGKNLYSKAKVILASKTECLFLVHTQYFTIVKLQIIFQI